MDVSVVDAGLCANCAHARPVESRRGPVYLLCRLSESDPGYPRYPRLPVRRCAGHAPHDAPPDDRPTGPAPR